MQRRRAIWIAIIALNLALAFLSFFYFRDNFSTHYPLKTLSAAILRTGAIPFWNFYAGSGQPLAGNPNTLTFYPTTLLYFLLPSHAAFNIHFLLHLIAAWFAMRVAAREFGASERGALTGAASYVLSGAAMSTLSFYNLSPALALIPAATVALKRLLRSGRWQGGLLLGSACGLLGLAGEPVVILGTALLLGAVAVPDLRRRHAPALLVSIAVATAVASPLLIAYGEIAGEVERGFRPYSSETVLAASLRPERLLEMITGPFLGLVTNSGASAYRYDRSAGEWPLFLPTVIAGPLLLIAAVHAAGPQARRLKIVAAGLLFIALGGFNPLIRAAVDRFDAARIIRYPEKLALVALFIAPILIALWIDSARMTRRAAVLLGAAVAGATLALLLTRNDAAAGTSLRLIIGCSAALLALLAAAAGRLRTAIAIHFLVLGFWAVRTVPIDAASHYILRSPLSPAIAGRVHFDYAGGIPGGTVRDQYRVRALRLDPLFGLTQGVTYGTDRSPEGMYSYLSAIVNERLAAAALPVRLRYLQLLGVSTVVADAPLSDRSLWSSPSPFQGLYIYRLWQTNGTIQPVSWPIPVRSVQEAVARIEGPDFDPSLHTIVPASNDVVPSGRVEIMRIDAEPQRVTLHVRAPEAASVVFNQSYFSAWSATADGRRLRIFPANIDRLGIEIPAGQRVITIEFGRRRAFVFAAWLLSTLLLLASAGLAIRSRTSIAEPAR